MSTKIDEREYKGYMIEVHIDESPQNPREYYNLGTMVCFHNRYVLGDSHTLDVEELKELITRKDVVSLPLFLYDHSGITMSTSKFSSPWDSGQIGYIYVTHKDVLEAYNRKRLSKRLLQKIISELEGEVEGYDCYIRGDVCGYIITKAGDEIESCWGFEGDPEKYMIPECKKIIDAINGETLDNILGLE